MADNEKYKVLIESTHQELAPGRPAYKCSALLKSFL
jgi:hypothetical protein